MKFNRMELNAFDPDGVGVDNGTYFGLPFEPGTAELVLVSAPWDVTVSYGAGTAHAPDAVIEASTQLDFHEPLAPGVWRRGIATADVDYALLEESQRLRSDAEKVIAHLAAGRPPCHPRRILRKLRCVRRLQVHLQITEYTPRTNNVLQYTTRPLSKTFYQLTL